MHATHHARIRTTRTRLSGDGQPVTIRNRPSRQVETRIALREWGMR